MNDADKKAFEAHWKKSTCAGYNEKLAAKAAWQAACEWRDSQVGEPVAKCAWSDLYNGVVLCSAGSEDTFDGRLYRNSSPTAAQINQQIVEALEQITNVYQSMRETLHEKYPQDGWSAETMTLDKAQAALRAARGK